MADSTNNSVKPLSDSNRNDLLNRIDKLERLLAKKRTTSDPEKVPRLKVGTDGIPVLIEPVKINKDIPADDKTTTPNKKEDLLIDDIINRIDKEIAPDLDKLIRDLKDSILAKVKIRLAEELHKNTDNTDKNQIRK